MVDLGEFPIHQKYKSDFPKKSQKFHLKSPKKL